MFYGRDARKMRTYLMKKLSNDLQPLAQACYLKDGDHAAANLKVAVQNLVDDLADKLAQVQSIAGGRIIRLVCQTMEAAELDLFVTRLRGGAEVVEVEDRDQKRYSERKSGPGQTSSGASQPCVFVHIEEYGLRGVGGQSAH